MTDMTAGKALLEALKSVCHTSTTIANLNKVMASWMLEQSKDVAALRASVKGLDPTFQETFEQKRKEADTSSQFAPVVAQLQSQLDEMIQGLDGMIRAMGPSVN
jgi:methyl-accepting chemotaxis protein